MSEPQEIHEMRQNDAAAPRNPLGGDAVAPRNPLGTDAAAARNPLGAAPRAQKMAQIQQMPARNPLGAAPRALKIAPIQQMPARNPLGAAPRAPESAPIQRMPLADQWEIANRLARGESIEQMCPPQKWRPVNTETSDHALTRLHRHAELTFACAHGRVSGLSAPVPQVGFANDQSCHFAHREGPAPWPSSAGRIRASVSPHVCRLVPGVLQPCVAGNAGPPAPTSTNVSGEEEHNDQYGSPALERANRCMNLSARSLGTGNGPTNACGSSICSNQETLAPETPTIGKQDPARKDGAMFCSIHQVVSDSLGNKNEYGAQSATNKGGWWPPTVEHGTCGASTGPPPCSHQMLSAQTYSYVCETRSTHVPTRSVEDVRAERYGMDVDISRVAAGHSDE